MEFMTDSVRLSMPPVPARPRRALTERELLGLLRAADVLMPASGPEPAASRAPGFVPSLDVALGARLDAFELIAAEGDRLSTLNDEELAADLRRLATTEPATFQPLSTVLAGAYLQIPEVRAAIGYPGQHRKHPQFDEAANDIMDGILDSVIERGSVYTPA
jgi:hypothetical protein